MGAAVGCGFGRIFQKLTGEDPGHAPRFLIAGSVAGLAAAFGAPFAGMLFAFEEVKTIVTVPLLLFTGVASFSAWFVITILFGFGLVFPFSSIPSLDWGQMWLPVLFGVGTGLFSALYNTALLRVTEFHDHQKLVPAPLKPLLPFLLSGVLLYVYPQVLVGLGYSTADLGGLTPNGPLLLGSVALLLFVKIIFSILSFASGVPGRPAHAHARHRQHGRAPWAGPCSSETVFPPNRSFPRISCSAWPACSRARCGRPSPARRWSRKCPARSSVCPKWPSSPSSPRSSPTGSARPRYTTP